MDVPRQAAGFSAALVMAFVLSAGPAAAQGMTGPIDTGTVRTQTINPSQGAPPPAAAPKPSAAPNAAVPKLDIKAFYGKFSGTGFADGRDVAYFGLTLRDLDVRIEPSGNDGFMVAWTTVLRDSADAKVSHIRRREASLTFAPGAQPGIYRATASSEPLTGDTWATVTRNTLTVHQFRVRTDGRHEMETYARTLSGSGMDLVYTRDLDGASQRRVRGKLVKEAK